MSSKYAIANENFVANLSFGLTLAFECCRRTNEVVEDVVEEWSKNWLLQKY